MKSSLITAAVLIAFASTGRAQIVVSGNVGVGGTATFEIQSDLVFPITSTGVVGALVFDEWVTSDGTANTSSFSSSLITLSIGGTPSQLSLGVIGDNLNANLGGLTANDGYVRFGNYAVVNGDAVTVKAGSWTFPGRLNFNPSSVQSFTGAVFLADAGTGNRMSSSISAGPVPEPSQYAQVAGAAVLGWALMRRFRRVQANRVG